MKYDGYTVCCSMHATVCSSKFRSSSLSLFSIFKPSPFVHSPAVLHKQSSVQGKLYQYEHLTLLSIYHNGKAHTKQIL